MRVVSLLVVGLTLAACAHDGRILVVVDADPVLRGELDRLEVSSVRTDGSRPEVRGMISLTAHPLPVDFVVAPAGGAAMGVTIRVDGLDRSGARVIRRTVRTGLVRGETRRLDIFLSASCRGTDCDGERTCITGGLCVDARIPVEELPIIGHPGELDAATDTPARDVPGLDAPAPDVPGLDAGGDAPDRDAPELDGGTDARIVGPVTVTETRVLLPRPEAAAAPLFGASVALNHDGTVAVVGASLDTTTVGFGGSAQIFRGDTLAPGPLLEPIAPDGSFGAAVAVGGRAECRVLVGSPGFGFGRGTGYVFGCDGTAEGPFPAGPPLSFAGTSVALTASGRRALLGAPGGAGAIYLFDLTSSWMPASGFVLPTGGTTDAAGQSVALSGDGLAAAVGVPFAMAGPREAHGRAFVLADDGTSTELVHAGPDRAFFGWSVALSADGARAAVSRAGEVVVFRNVAPVWLVEQVLSVPEAATPPPALAMDDAGAWLLAGGGAPGTAWFFHRTGSAWTEVRRATGARGFDAFGASVAVSGNGRRALVGASQEGGAGADAGRGAVHVYELSAP